MDRRTSLIEFFASIRGMSNEQRLVSDKANEEARRLHQENPDGALGLPRAIPVTEPNEDPNGDGLPLLEHCKGCLLERMGEGVPEQKRLTMVQAVRQKSTEDPSQHQETVQEIPGDGKRLPHLNSKLWAHRQTTV